MRFIPYSASFSCSILAVLYTGASGARFCIWQVYHPRRLNTGYYIPLVSFWLCEHLDGVCEFLLHTEGVEHDRFFPPMGPVFPGSGRIKESSFGFFVLYSSI